MSILGNSVTLGGGLTPGSAVIHVTAPAGSTISFAKGGVTVKELDASKSHVNATDSSLADWYYSVSSSNYGTWTVTASSSGRTAFKNITVDANRQYDLKLISKYEWSCYSKFIGSGLSQNSWVSTDGVRLISLDAGTWTVTDGKLIANGSTRYSALCPGSYVLLGIRCSISSSFTPSTAAQWYKRSCIIGRELGNVQKDFGLLIGKSGNYYYPGIGYSESSYVQSSNAIFGDTEYDLFILTTTSNLRVFVNNTQVASVTYTMGGTAISNVGIFWNKAESSSTVKGSISAVGIWTYTDIGGSEIILPSLD